MAKHELKDEHTCNRGGRGNVAAAVREGDQYVIYQEVVCTICGAAQDNVIISTRPVDDKK